jgi:hypothetical protein
MDGTAVPFGMVCCASLESFEIVLWLGLYQHCQQDDNPSRDNSQSRRFSGAHKKMIELGHVTEPAGPYGAFVTILYMVGP